MRSSRSDAMKKSVSFSENFPTKRTHYWRNFKRNFNVSLFHLLYRIFLSFMPPVINKFSYVYVDLLGPTLAFVSLFFILNYGYYAKYGTLSFVPLQSIIIYSFVLPVLCVLSSKFSQSRSKLTLSGIFSIFGYAMYGHLSTLSVSYLVYKDQSSLFFFLCMTVFSGLSTLRMAMLIMSTTSVPAGRFMIGSTISLINILFVIYWHFAFMHRSFFYGNKV